MRPCRNQAEQENPRYGFAARDFRMKENMKKPKIPKNWEAWCKRGSHKGTRKKNAVLRSLKSGLVRGYFSDLVLDPDLEPSNSM